MFTARAITALDVQRLSDQQHFCVQYGCTAFHDEEIIGDDWRWIHDGSSIVQYIEAVPGGPRRTWEGPAEEDDDLDSDASSCLEPRRLCDPLEKFLNRSAAQLAVLQSARPMLDETDETTLMGRNPVVVRQQDLDAFALPDDNPWPEHMLPGRWFSVIIFRLGKANTYGRIASGDLQSFFVQVSQLMEAPEPQIAELHELNCAPLDLAPVYDYIWISHMTD